MPADIAERRRMFRALHESGCFVIPNPWDAGSARYLEHLGFKALATTSSGFAWSMAHADNAMSRDDVLTHLKAIAAFQRHFRPRRVDGEIDSETGNLIHGLARALKEASG